MIEFKYYIDSCKSVIESYNITQNCLRIIPHLRRTLLQTFRHIFVHPFESRFERHNEYSNVNRNKCNIYINLFLHTSYSNYFSIIIRQWKSQTIWKLKLNPYPKK